MAYPPINQTNKWALVVLYNYTRLLFSRRLACRNWLAVFTNVLFATDLSACAPFLPQMVHSPHEAVFEKTLNT
jgi:hypothetical protein